MMIASDRVLDRLPADEPCLGALFMSYSFDPVFSKTMYSALFFDWHPTRSNNHSDTTMKPAEHSKRHPWLP